MSGPVRTIDAAGLKAALHDGGEIIFNLLNGLQAYFLTDARGNRLNGASARQPGSGLGATASLASLGAGGALRIRF